VGSSPVLFGIANYTSKQNDLCYGTKKYDVICREWLVKDKKTIVNNYEVKCGTFNGFVNKIEALSQRIIEDKKKLPILFTTGGKTSQTENYSFQTGPGYYDDHEIYSD
jgi:hypothetical protein